MSQIRLLFTFFAALIVALAASYLVYKQVARRADPLSGTTNVFVAARNLPIGVPLAEQDLKGAPWGAENLPAGAVTDASELLGRTLIYPVFAGEPVLLNKLAPEGSGAGLSAVISEGMRAVSIRVDEVVAVAGFVVAGTRVDVLLTGTPSESGGERVTQTILENVQVLAAGQQIQPDAEGKPESVNVVTLLCTPEDASRVVLAASEGRIQLVLRNPSDGELDGQPTPIVKRTQLYSKAAPPPPPAAARAPAPRVQPPAPVVVAPPPPTTTSIQMIRGSSISEVEVPLPR